MSPNVDPVRCSPPVRIQRCTCLTSRLLFSGTVPLFETLFASLSVSELFPSAIDVLLEILQKPTTFTNAKIAYQNRLAFEQNNDTQIMLSIIARITTIKETTFASAIKGTMNLSREW